MNHTSWIAVKEYGNGQFINKVYPQAFSYLSKCAEKCDELNEREKLTGYSERWIPMSLFNYD